MLLGDRTILACLLPGAPPIEQATNDESEECVICLVEFEGWTH